MKCPFPCNCCLDLVHLDFFCRFFSMLSQFVHSTPPFIHFHLFAGIWFCLRKCWVFILVPFNFYTHKNGSSIHTCKCIALDVTLMVALTRNAILKIIYGANGTGVIAENIVFETFGIFEFRSDATSCVFCICMYFVFVDILHFSNFTTNLYDFVFIFIFASFVRFMLFPPWSV